MENNAVVLTSIGLTVCGAIFLFIISGIYYSGKRFPGYESTIISSGKVIDIPKLE